MEIIKDVKQISPALTYFSPVLHFILQPVSWCGLLLKWLVSIWNRLIWTNFLFYFSVYIIVFVNGLVCISTYPASNDIFKVNNRNTRKRCEMCSKLTIKTPEGRHWSPSGVFIVNFEHIPHLALVFLFIALSK